MATFRSFTAGGDYQWWPDLAQMDFFSNTLAVTRNATTYAASWSQAVGNISVEFTGTGLEFSDGTFPDGERPIAGKITAMTIRVDGVTWYTVTGINKDAADIDHFWSGWSQDGNYRGGDGFDLFSFLASGNDKIYGTDNSDDIFTGRNPGNDSIYAGGGDDFIKADAGNDLISGGAGWDTYSLSEANFDSSASKGAKVNLTKGTVTDSWGGIDKISGIEQVEGSRFSDSITGSGRDERIIGGRGADTLAGAGGYDVLDYSKEAQRGGVRGVTVNLDTGRGIDSWGGTDKISGFEKVLGTAKADSLTGDGLANFLEGGDGADTLVGGGGADTLLGLSGADRMTGGTGADVFLFGGWEGTDPFGDTITDFVSGTDTLSFDTASIDGMTTTLQFEVGTASTLTGQAFFYNSGTKELWWDADGSGAGAAVLVVTLTSGSIAAGDIALG